MIMKIVISIGAMYLQNYDFDRLLDNREFKLIILAGEYRINLNQELLKKYNIEHYIIKKISHNDPRVERFLDEDLVELVSLLRSKHGNEISLHCDSEIDLLQVARVRKILQIPGPEELELIKFRNKIIMKEYLVNHGVNIPKFMPLEHYLKLENMHLAYKKLCKDLKTDVFIIKPSSQAGSNGFVKIKSFADYENFIKNDYNLSLEYLVEDFMNGNLFHIDGVIRDGTVLDLFVCEYTVPNADMLNGCALGSIPIANNVDKYVILKKYALNLVEHIFRIKNSAFHLEVFYDELLGKINFLEIGHRPPGAWVSKLYMLNYSYNIFNQHLIVANQLNVSTDYYDYNNIKYALGYIPTVKGIYCGVYFPEGMTSIFSFDSSLVHGEEMLGAKNVGGIAATFKLYNENYQQLLSDFYLLRNKNLLVKPN